MASQAESPFPPPSFRPLLAEISSLLTQPTKTGDNTPITIAVAETTTGGLISAALLSVAGASKFYVGGATLYTRESRLLWGGWDEKQLKDYKGPTKEIVAGLAKNVGSTLNATYCIGESGTAGPTVAGPPYIYSIVGTVALAVVSKDGRAATRIVETGLGNDREKNMVAFAEAALSLLRDVLTGAATFQELDKVKDEKDPKSSGTPKF